MNYLLSALNACNSADESADAEALPKMQVILRMRPANSASNEKQADVYRLDAAQSQLLVRSALNANEAARRASATLPNEQHADAFKSFGFERIFGPQVDQAQFFSEAVEPALADLLNNQRQSSFVSYGSSDAGKTYTLHGTGDDPGVIPRSIAFIFASIQCSPGPRYKPAHSGQGVVALDEPERQRELQAREELLLACRALDRAACERAYAALQARQQPRSGARRTATAAARFSLWISFIEVYNEAVLDLLQVDEQGKNAALKLATDKRGSTYAQGMRTVCATTGLQAYEILNAGQARLSTAASTTSYKSSRSHSIFTMRLLKHDADSPQPPSPTAVQMGSVSFYDLAAPGKPPKSAPSSDKRSKESRSINSSLLAFGRCLKALAEGHSRQSTGPFRDSKLTRLFQHSLRKENLIILVNVNPSSELFAETQNVLNFASTAMKLTSELAKEDKRSLDYQSAGLSSPEKLGEARVASAASAAGAPRSLPRSRQMQDVVARNKQLQDQIKDLKSAELSREYKLRQDLADFYSKQLNDLEDIWKNRMSAAEADKDCLLKFPVDGAHSHYRRQASVKQTTLQVDKFTRAAKDENTKLSLQNTQYALEASWLSESLHRMSDWIASAASGGGGGDGDSILDCLATKSFLLFDNHTISHVQSIAVFLKEHLAEQQLASCHRESRFANSQVQCDLLDYSLFDRHCETIEELFGPNDNSVSLPVLDDSDADRKSPVNDFDLQSTFNRLSRVTQSIVQCLSDRKALELENAHKEQALRLLRRASEQQDVEILRLKEELVESESCRMLLLKKCDNLESASKSREFFKNPDFDAVESENSLDGALHRELIRSEEADDSYRMSRANFEMSDTRCSFDGSSKNDSGVAVSLDSVIAKEDKYCQTDAGCPEDQNRMLKEKLTQLNLDYTRMGAQHSQGSRRISELSLELERIGEAMVQLKENTFVKDRTISECQGKLNDNKIQMERLSAEKRQLETKFDELRDQLLLVSKDCERNLAESQVKLKMHEEAEQTAARCLKEYWQRSVNLGSELSMAYSQLEECSIRCYQEHVLKIYKLEEELSEKTATLANLKGQVCVYEKDLAEMMALSGKVDEFEKVLIRLHEEKSEVEKIVESSSESQSIIQKQVEHLTERIGERDKEILSLKWQLDTIIKANLSNSRTAKELAGQLTRLTESICSMKDDIGDSESARAALERKSSKEMDNLRARLSVFEGNAELLNVIRNSGESKQCELDKLKLKVLEKESELQFFKKNRNATIERYERLVKQLRIALKMQNNAESSLKKALPCKEERSLLHLLLNDSKEGTSCYLPRVCSWQRWQDWRNHEKSRCPMPSNCNAGISLHADKEDYLEARTRINSFGQMSRRDRSASCLRSCMGLHESYCRRRRRRRETRSDFCSNER